MQVGGLLSNMRGVSIDAFRVTFSGGNGTPTLVDNGKSGLATVALTAAGRYTFSIQPPTNPKMVAIFPSLSCVAANGAVRTPRYVEGSYAVNGTTGVASFEIDITDDEATPAAIAPTDNTALDVLLFTQKYNGL